MKLPNGKILGVISAVAIVFAIAIGYVLGSQAETAGAPSKQASRQIMSESPEIGAASKTSTEKQLIYMIEEEKLAHDVYSKLYEMYGSRVFGNILQSEATHQSRVLVLLEERNIDDPRRNEPGVFNNAELQDLYNQMIKKGQQSLQDAYEVGVAIEERDIADITKQLETAAEVDVIQVLEGLRRGSENHLRAFSRQL